MEVRRLLGQRQRTLLLSHSGQQNLRIPADALSLRVSVEWPRWMVTTQWARISVEALRVRLSVFCSEGKFYLCYSAQQINLPSGSEGDATLTCQRILYMVILEERAEKNLPLLTSTYKYEHLIKNCLQNTVRGQSLIEAPPRSR